ncbi:putative toxin-antitoxin system toxin component, PIN family [Bosea sp. (in: a-proteobacteria)]|uniref:putative toxin-antitoxin system toxin component, PIN family n=1 Tax=Bosea sp. (in: a-proteobacteria) TaxID=1871050 RepID=UPI00273478EA|nr:putative toxin-antitoxin system toxin component, PIN family [Bosea sp. (in: a-proteobacteria)]MDP3408885.1 putative toxin-antitoxin system toxin component, PIN family [Bosea sp. (in: a-proteobacteria)]
MIGSRLDITCDMLSDMLRVVLDTSVMVSGFRSRTGASHALLVGIGRGLLVPAVSHALFLEYEDVLKRPAQQAVHGLSNADIDVYLAGLAAVSDPVEIWFRWRPQLRDPADDLVLEAAANGRVATIVTHNLRDFAGVTERFGIRILTPGDLLKEMI